MGPGEIVESIIEYGIYPVLMGILLWLLLAMQKRQNRAAEEQEKRLTALIDSSIKLAIHDSKKHSPTEEADNRKVATYIKSQLTAIVQENGANRAFCVAYHNACRIILQ